MYEIYLVSRRVISTLHMRRPGSPKPACETLTFRLLSSHRTKDAASEVMVDFGRRMDFWGDIHDQPVDDPA